MPSLADFTKKIANYFATWTTRNGENLARNTALAAIFGDLSTEIDRTKRLLTINGAEAEQAIAVGTYWHPRVIQGVRFFYISPELLPSTISGQRTSTLRHFYNAGQHQLSFDRESPISITSDGEIYKLKGGMVYVQVDLSKMPTTNLTETVEWIPIYDYDYIKKMGELHGIPRWRNETDDHYKSRMIATIGRIKPSLPGVTAAVKEYCDYYRLTFKLQDYREHYAAWFVVGMSFISDYDGQRKYKKDRSDNVSYLTLDVKMPTEITDMTIDMVKNELFDILVKNGPQGCRYQVTVTRQ